MGGHIRTMDHQSLVGTAKEGAFRVPVRFRESIFGKPGSPSL